MIAAMPVVFQELALPPPPEGAPGPFALADADRLAALVGDAGYRDVETGTITVIVETDTVERFVEWSRDDAPTAIIDLFNAQPPEVQKRVQDKVTQAYSQFQQADGRVRTENQAIWVVGTR